MWPLPPLFPVVPVLVLTAIAAAALIPGGMGAPSPAVLAPPGPAHLLGTTDLGEDVLVQLIRGAAPTLGVGVGAGIGGACAALLAAVLAAASPLADRMVLRAADVMTAVPTTAALMLAASLVQPGPPALVALIVLSDWHWSVRPLRARVLVLWRRDSVDAARGFGAGLVHITTRHILPGLTPLLAAVTVNGVRLAVFQHAGLALLGLTDPRAAGWGAMLHDSLRVFRQAPWFWWGIPPALCLAGVLLWLVAAGLMLEARADPARKETNG